MSDESAATGGFLVIIGVILVLGIGVLLFKQGVFDRHSGPEITVELPDGK